MQTPSPVVGVFRDQAKVDGAVAELTQAGFRADQIKSTTYDLTTTQEAQNTVELPAENIRIILAVNAEGRDQEAVKIFANNGGNNSDLPAGMIVEHGVLVKTTSSAEAQTDTVTNE